MEESDRTVESIYRNNPTSTLGQHPVTALEMEELTPTPAVLSAGFRDIYESYGKRPTNRRFPYLDL